MMRIYRNLRFSRDKTPYHTNASAAFGHRDGAHFNSPSFYLSLSPAEAFAGVGVWHPQADTVAKIRDAIVAQPSKWKSAVNDRKFKARFEMMGDMLSRPPKGYDPAHPLIEDLKRKDFVGGTRVHAQGSLLGGVHGFVFEGVRVVGAVHEVPDRGDGLEVVSSPDRDS